MSISKAEIVIFIIIMICIVLSVVNELKAEIPDGLKPLLHAIHWRESSFGTNMDGEAGSLGPYQIRKLYWIDAIEHRPEIGGEYKDCVGKEYSESVMLSYWDRYAKGSADYETLARLHNGGPKGPSKRVTLKYWKDIKNFLDNQ